MNTEVAELRGTRMRLNVDASTSFGRELLEHGERQSELFLVPLMRALLGPGGVFFDIGAHWGTYSLVGSELVGDAGRVLSVEPHRPSLERIRENLALNACSNVTPIGCAVGPQPARGALRIGGSGDNLNRLTDAASWLKRLRGRFGFGHTRETDVRTLDSILDETGVARVRLMKMDIEGGEWPLGASLSSALTRVDALLIELHPRWSRPEDEAAMYDCLARERVLFAVDEERRGLVRVETREEFDKRIPQYYFVSAAQEPAEVLRGFNW